MDNYDIRCVTINSLSEGIGSSQITPLNSRLSKTRLKINLISYENYNQKSDLVDFFKLLGVAWNYQPFESHGLVDGLERLNHLRRAKPKTNLFHLRSDIPAVAGIASGKAPVLWDAWSLWADQKQ